MTEQNFDAMRRAMVVSQLRTNGVSDPRVVAVMSEVPRERFVPGDRRGVAYVDTLVPLGGGRALAAPMALGKLLTEARVRPADRVLVIGAATGYAAAVIARLAGSVTALEEDAGLAEAARAALADSGVALVEGPLNAGWQAGAPYDLIVIDGAVEVVPPAIVAQLTGDGRIVTGLLDAGVTRLAVGRRAGEGFGLVAFADVETPVLPGFARPRGFSF